MEDIGRRTVIGLAAAAMAAPALSTMQAKKLRRIATEEAFATPELAKAWLEIARTNPDVSLDVQTGIKFLFDNPPAGSGPDRYRRQALDFHDERLRIMDEAGIDMQLLSVTIPGVQMFAPDRGIAMAIATNDMLADVVKQHPSRYTGLACVAPQAPRQAAVEMERAINTLKLNGFIINSHTNDAYLDEPQFAAVLEAADALDRPIYLHPRSPSNGMAAPFRDYSIGGSIWGFGIESGTHAVRLIMSGVLDRYPKLRIVLGHMGEALPFWMWRLDHMQQRRAKDGRMKPLQLKPSEYFRRNFAVTTSGFEDADILALVIKKAGIENVMFAVDYPFESSIDAVKFIDKAKLAPKDLAAVYHLNAERIFHIAPLV